MSARHTRGILFAGIAACCFGITAPALGRFEPLLHVFTVSSLLSLGMVYSALVTRLFGSNGPGLQRGYIPRLVLISLVGAVLVPGLLAYGLSKANGIAACLLINLEAVFTAVLATIFYRERISARFSLGLLAITCGAIVLMARSSGQTEEMFGLLAVGLATALWSVDSALSRPLAGFDPSEVVFWKGAFGCAIAVPAALYFGDAPGDWPTLAAVVLCGMLGYGAMEYFYLMGQRMVGVARTGAIFSTAPFFGATISLLLGAPMTPTWGVAGLMMAFGLWLHATDGAEEEEEQQPSAPAYAATPVPVSRGAPAPAERPRPLTMPPPSWTRELR